MTNNQETITKYSKQLPMSQITIIKWFVLLIIVNCNLFVSCNLIVVY